MRIIVVKQISLILLLSLSTPALWAQTKSRARVPNARLIGRVSRMADGCGCYFRFAKEDGSRERYVFFEDVSYGAPVMNIGGRDIKLRLVSSTEPPNGVDRKGQRFSRRYAAGDIKVHLALVATSVCPGPYNPECVANSYDVTLTAIKGTRRQTIKASGSCGC